MLHDLAEDGAWSKQGMACCCTHLHLEQASHNARSSHWDQPAQVSDLKDVHRRTQRMMHKLRFSLSSVEDRSS